MAARQQTVTASEITQAVTVLTDTAALGVATAQSLQVSNAVIDGTISYRGFDGMQRSFFADTNAQARYLRSNAGGGFSTMRTTGRALVGVAVPLGGYDIGAGYRSGNHSQMFDGGFNLATLAAASVNPGIAIGMAITKLGHDLMPEAPSTILDDAALVDMGCPRPGT